MKITALEEYGLRCMLQIARAGRDSSVTISELAQREGLSVPYIAKVMRSLRQRELVTSARGQSGGYSLVREPAEISVGEVLEALSEKLYDASFCKEHAGNEELCVHIQECSIRTVWREVQTAVNSILCGITLADLLLRERDLQSQLAHKRGEPPRPQSSGRVLATMNAHSGGGTCGDCGHRPPTGGCGAAAEG